MINFVIILCLIAAPYLVWIGTRQLARRRVAFGVPVLAVALMIGSVGANALPSLPLIGPLLQHGPYRTKMCENVGPLVARALSLDAKTGAEDSSSAPKCAVELVVNSGKDIRTTETISAKDCWVPSQERAQERNCYSLATLEFADNGSLAAPAQLSELQHHLSRLRDVLRERAAGDEQEGELSRTATNAPGIYLIAYVHGWRNDARSGNNDLRRLRVLASAASRDIAVRCSQARRYCNTAVVAVFIGWQGAASLWDSESTRPPIMQAARVLNGLTFASRKNVSDRIGESVIAQLNGIRAMADGMFGNDPITGKSANRMLVLGHSLGGNTLLSGISKNAAGDPKIGLAADLTILINPATETSKWFHLARRVRDARAWPATTAPRLVFLVSPADYELDQAAKADHTNAVNGPAPESEQTPKEIAARRLEMERQIAAENEFDNVVEDAFRINQYVSTWPTRDCSYAMTVYGLGHLADGAGGCKRGMMDSIYTHFIEVNYTANTDVSPANYINAADTARSCFIEPSFLYCARSRASEARGARCGKRLPSGPFNDAWDFGSLGGGETLGSVRYVTVSTAGLADPELTKKAPLSCKVPPDLETKFGKRLRRSQQINAQIGSGLGPRHPRKEFYSPLWGVRVFPNALQRHSGFWTAPLECMFNKLVLDDPLGNEEASGVNPGAELDRYRVDVSMPTFQRSLEPRCAKIYASISPRYAI